MICFLTYYHVHNVNLQVDVARHAFGDMAANAVFLMTIVNSLGVCAAYSTFIGSTMATLSSTPGNIIFDLAPGTTNEVK